MDQLIELLKQIQELAGAAIDALEGAAGGGGEQPPAEGGGAPAESGGAPAGPAEEMPPGK
jgi:hypothetical protein